MHGGLVFAVRGAELNGWKQFKVFQPPEGRAPSKSIPDTCRVLTRKMVDGEEGVKARLVAKGYQGPDVKHGNADASRRASLRSPRIQVISLEASKKWSIWSLGIQNAFLLADGFGRKVCLRPPVGWDPEGTHRVWKLNAPAYGLRNVPMAFHRAPQLQLLKSGNSLARAGLGFQVPSFEPRSYLIFREISGADGAIATHIDDIRMSCQGARFFGTPFRGVEGSGKVLCTSGRGGVQGERFLGLNPIPAPPEPWAARQRPLPSEEIKARQCKLEALCWLAAVPPPDIRASLARIASCVNSLQGSYIYRIND